MKIVNGNWGAFGAYGACSVSCGVGTQTRTRQCNNPAPNACGASCPGSATETRACGKAIVKKKCKAPCKEETGCAAQTGGGITFNPLVGGIGGMGIGLGGYGGIGMGLGGLGVLGQVGCVDRRTECSIWAKSGYCSQTPYYSYMMSSCCRSCRDAATGGGGGGGVSCVDTNTRDCKAWATAGFCTDPTYRYYMKDNCCLSCQGLISANIRDSSNRLRFSPHKYVQMMTAELKKKKK